MTARYGCYFQSSCSLPPSPSKVALIEEVVRQLPDLVSLGCRHPEPVVDHKLRKLVAVDENDLLALDPFHEVHGVLRECRGRENDPLLRPDVIHTADEALDDGSAHRTVPPFRLNAHHVQPELVLLDHPVDAAVARLARDGPLGR